MKTTLKKALSVLMAVLVFVGGLFVAFNIDNISAENDAYTAEYDYTASALKSQPVKDNMAALGIYAMSPTNEDTTTLYINENSSPNGISAIYDQMVKKAYGSFDKAYVIYQVEPGTKFEASLIMYMNRGHAWCRNGIEAATGESFNITIEASANGVDGWKNAWDTSVITDTESIVKEYDVPADCSYVKITLPQTGYVVSGGNTVATNDTARIAGVKFVKPVVEEITYDTEYDYTDTTKFDHASVSAATAANYGMVGVGTGLFIYEDKGQNRFFGINPTWSTLNNAAWGNFETYVIYEVQPGSYFEASLYLASNSGNKWCKQAIAEATGEPFEFVIEASDSKTGGWKNAKDTSSYAEKDVTMTYKVPADCSYVKITFPQKGKATVQGTEIQGNDLGRLLGVKYTKAVPKTYTKTYDYSTLGAQGVSTSNAAALGMYAVNTTGAAGLTVEAVGKGINPNYNTLNANAWGTLENASVVYEVTPGTWFEATLFLASQTGNIYCKEKISEVTGEPFEFTFEASATANGGWKNVKDTSGITGNGSATFTFEYLVPNDCSFVKITFPQKGYINANDANQTKMATQDRAKLMGVKYTALPEKTFANEYDYSYVAGGANDVAINANSIAANGIYAMSGSSAPGLLLNCKSGNTVRNGIEPSYHSLNSKAWGQYTNAYVIYEVVPGTWFEADLYLASSTAANPSAYTKQAISAKTGEPFEFEISASVDGNSWKNVKDTASITDANIKFEYLIPEDCNFVKVSFPQKGKISGVPHNGNASDLKTIQANDLARLLKVRCTAPVPAFNTTYDYTTDLVAQYATISGSNAAQLGLAGFSNGLIYDEQKKNVGIGASMTAINASAWGETEFYLIYEVTPGTKFSAEFQLNTAAVKTGWGKETFAHLAGEPWEFTISASDSDTSGWKNVVTSADQTEKFFTIEYEVPADCTFVKITFPQKGRVEPFCDECNEYHLRDESTKHYGLQGNDLAKVRKVSFTAPENHFVDCETVMDYKANGPVNFFYDNDAFLISLYQKNGIAVEAISTGSTLVAPDKNYVAGTGYSKPYVTYAVMPSTNFVAAINVNRTAAAALGADFKVKLYESADGATWTENTVAPIAAGATDYFKFETAATTKFVKIEFPHTDANNQTDKYNEIFGIAKVGLTRDESAYEIENPYGNYTFGESHKFYGDPRPASFNADELNIYELAVPGALGFETDPAKPGYYLAYTYGNLVGKESVAKAALVYSVKPGTAFQVIALLSRDDGFIQSIERKLGTNWDITLEISADGKTWSEYKPSRVLTEEHLLDSTPARYTTEVITIPVLPSDAKFVKIVYPQTGDMSKVTEGAFPYTGNDLIGIAKVSLTNGGAVPASKYVPDKSKYNSVIDATLDATPDDSIAYVTGLQYDKGMQVLAPSWTYLNGTGNAVMAQTGIYAIVKEGSAFYAEAAFRSSLHICELDENGDPIKNKDGNVVVLKTVDPFKYIEGYGARLYFSSDRVTWTEVTDQYRQVVNGSGSLPVLHRFDIEKLPAGVKYVKVELPINRNMVGCPVGDEGYATAYTGNDWCGIRRLYFNADEHIKYKSEINYGNYFTKEYGSGFPTSLTGENNKVLGIHSYTPGAFEIKDFTSSDTPDGRILIKESYLFNKKEVDAPYLVYNVEANSPLYIGVNVSAVGRLSAMPNGRLRLYTSETGEEGSWTELTEYTYVENAAHTFGRYFADNLGAKTKYLMIVFPLTGDLSLNPDSNSKGNSGSNFFQIRDVYTNVVDFDPTWDNKKEYVFIHPNGEQQVIIPGEVIVTPTNWLLIGIIAGAAVLVLAAAAVVVILIVKKKKKAAKPQA